MAPWPTRPALGRDGAGSFAAVDRDAGANTGAPRRIRVVMPGRVRRRTREWAFLPPQGRWDGAAPASTRRRRNRQKLYEEWGFPELWVEVPDAHAPSRPAGLRSGMRIYLLEAGRYVLADESRAFPGWLAAEVHRALNEWILSEETSAVLFRVGRSLGEREGRGPEDDVLLGPYARERRVEGRAVGVAEGVGRMARTLLRRRGVPVPPHFPEGLAGPPLDHLRAASAEQVVDTASATGSFADFLARLDDPGS